jgi:hypothetical protein
LSDPPVRFSTSAANLRVSRSRKSPVSAVPPGNWCEILMTRASAARAACELPMIAGAAASPLRISRRVKAMVPVLLG